MVLRWLNGRFPLSCKRRCEATPWRHEELPPSDQLPLAGKLVCFTENFTLIEVGCTELAMLDTKLASILPAEAVMRWVLRLRRHKTMPPNSDS